MHISLFLGPNVSGPSEDRRAIELCIEQALLADSAGFAAVYVGEQHFNDYEPYSNPIVMAAYLAGQFKQAYLGTSMIPLPLHHPLMLVERINLLDQLTRGRCIIGLSAGAPVPGNVFAVPDVPGRGPLFDEKLDVMLRAWTHMAGDEPLEFHTSAEAGVMATRMMPIAYRAPHPLFAIGTSTPAKMRAAGLAGRKIHTAGFDVANGTRLLGIYRDAMNEAELPTETIAANLEWFIHTKVIYVAETDDLAMKEAEPLLVLRSRLPRFVEIPPEQANMGLRELLTCDPGPMAKQMGAPESLAAFMQRAMIVGSPETVAAKLRTFGDAGLGHVHGRFAFGSLEDLGPFRRSLDLFIQEVMPRIDAQPMPPLEPDEIVGGEPALATS